MNIRFVTPTLHGLLDYAAAIALIVLPLLLNLGATSALALWLSIAGGVGLIVYSLLTSYRFSIMGLLSFRTHLVLDLAAAAVFLLAPLVFGWSGIVAAYYFTMGAGVLLVVGVSTPEPQPVGELV
ncbi:MAG: hypothetical protein QNJ73_15890 [Gammaproteobacteria bacterium]|nr:hypothetical protein [Gammaproteobacteria bacterium]